MAGLDFVAVVYNEFDDTRDFCDSLLKNVAINNGFDVRCFIVDNSTDDAVKSKIDNLESIYNFVNVLRPDKNVGYFGAFNFFFKSDFFEKNNDVVLCNNDLVFSENFCSIYNQSQYSDDVMVVCPNVITLDGVHQNPHLKNRMSRMRKLKLDLYFSHFFVAKILSKLKKRMPKKLGEIDSSGYIHMGIGACYILRRKFFEYTNLLDFPHFLYGEEAYFSNQVHQLNGRLYYDSELRVTHKESATLSKLPSKITYEFARDGYKYYRRYL